MKRAWTLLPLAWISVVTTIGCNQDSLARLWPPSNWGQKNKAVSEQAVISEPIPVEVTTAFNFTSFILFKWGRRWFWAKFPAPIKPMLTVEIPLPL